MYIIILYSDLDNMVSSSLLYGVAGGLSAALFIAICIIIYLIYRQKNMKLEDKEPLVNPYPKKNDKVNCYVIADIC